MICENLDCVFHNDGCIIPEDKNIFLNDSKGQFHCINYITDKKQVDKEAIKHYGL